MKFTVQLLVTEKCNLACPYCYEVNRDRFMTREILDQALDDIEAYAQKTRRIGIHISYFGGEPLMNWDLIKYSIPKVKARGWSQDIITNMTFMTDEILAFCREWGVKLSWSFDGMDSNKSRPLLRIPENQGYTKILDLYNNKKYLLLRAADKVHVMVGPHNCDHITGNFKFLLDWGITNPDFTIIYDNIWSNDDVAILGGEIHKLADEWMIQIRRGIKCAISLFTHAIMDTVVGISYDKSPTRCFSCTGGCAIKPDGNAYACARFATKGLMRYTKDHDFEYYLDLLDVRKYSKCQQCELYRICNAGCPYSEIQYGGPVDSICDITRIIYAETARVVHEMKDNAIFQDIVRNAVHCVKFGE